MKTISKQYRQIFSDLARSAQKGGLEKRK